MSTVTNRTTHADLGPRQCQGYSIQGHNMAWQQAEQPINRQHTTADVLSVLEVAVELDCQHVLYGFRLSIFLRVYIPDLFFPLPF